MGGIRPYEPPDAPQVLALHERTMLHGSTPSPAFAAYLETFYGKTLFAHPWTDDDMPSLVYERDDGTVLGFVGVVPRPATFAGAPIRVAVSVRFMVDHADPRAGVAAAALHLWFLRGAQDLSLVENANAAARQIWERARGTAVLPVASVSWSVDTSVAEQMPALAAGRGWESRPADDDELLACVRDSVRGNLWQPTYDAGSLGWLLGFLDAARYRGTLHRRVVVDAAGRVRGWYVFYANPVGYNGVLALRSVDGAAGAVLRHLLADVRRVGGSSVSTGRLRPELMSPLDEHNATLGLGPWALAHSRDPRITAALASGDAHLTRLEGEFC